MAPSPAAPRPRPLSTMWSPDRPVFLPNRDHHGAWVKPAAMELVGDHGATPDSVDGRIERDAGGGPTGCCRRERCALVGDCVPATTERGDDAALLAGQRYLHSLGVTGWQDAMVGASRGCRTSARRTARAAGDGTAHRPGRRRAVVGPRPRRGAVAGPRRAGAAAYSHDRFRATASRSCRTASRRTSRPPCSSPTSTAAATDRRTRHTRSSTRRRCARPSRRSTRQGFQVHVHAIGDRAVREALDAFEAPRREAVRRPPPHRPPAAGPPRRHAAVRGARRRREHAGPVGLSRRPDGRADAPVPRRGARAAGSTRSAPCTDPGPGSSIGSDWPVTTPDPLAAIHVAVNRTAYGEEGRAGTEPFLPEQALDPRRPRSRRTPRAVPG